MEMISCTVDFDQNWFWNSIVLLKPTCNLKDKDTSCIKFELSVSTFKDWPVVGLLFFRQLVKAGALFLCLMTNWNEYPDNTLFSEH